MILFYLYPNDFNMPFSFNNTSSTAILIMVLCLSVAELVNHLRKKATHSKK